MNRLSRFATVLLSLMLVAGIAAAPGQAKIKIKNGAYYQTAGKFSGFLITEKGKISTVSAQLKFRKNGEPCVPTGATQSGAAVGVAFAPAKPAGTNRKNRFSFKGIESPFTPSLKTSISGRFISANKASFTIKANEGACKARLTLKNAKYVAGG